MKKFIALFALLSLFVGISAQEDEFQVPKKYKIKTEEDCTKYKEDFVKCIDWLINTPINESPSKRKSANDFFLQWLTVTETVTIEMNTDVVNFGKDGNLMIIFMAAWAKDVIETEDNHKDILRGSLIGINAMIDFYQKNKDEMEKNSDIEKYIKLKEKGKLEETIQKKLK